MHAQRLGKLLGIRNLYIKRDDFTGKKIGDHRLYGGNKPRKLEWLLADAIAHNAKTVITYGCAGSNHALATAVYAQTLGLASILMLKPQPNSTVVRQNLLLDKAHHATLSFYPNNTTRDAARDEILQNDPSFYFIPTGGSTPLGALGFVNAAFELYEQINQGIMPMPDRIYVPMGSCGTTAGLLVGLTLLNMPTTIIAVAVEPEEEPCWFETTVQKLYNDTLAFLHAADKTIPLLPFDAARFVIVKKFWGTEYGLWTQEGAFAYNLLKNTEDLALEGTYSTKPWSALLDDIIQKNIKDETILIWHTYCGLDFSHCIDNELQEKLPSEAKEYFKNELQLLNQLIEEENV